MASQWFYKADPDPQCPTPIRGPVSFQELAQLIADNQLARDSVARREFGSEWQPVDQIVGLRRLIEKIRSRSTTTQSPQPSEDEAVHRCESVNFDRPADGERAANHLSQRMKIGVVSVVALLLLAGWWARPRWERFPKPAQLQHAQQASRWSFPLIGEVSGFEFSLLVFDVFVIMAMTIWWLRRRADYRHPHSSEPRGEKTNDSPATL